MSKVQITFLITVLTAVLSHAQIQATQNVTAELISEVKSIKPGEKFWVALKLNMAEKWHTYWRNPGDAGLPTEINWSLPEGFEVSGIYWPYPEIFETGGVVSYGYKNEILLLSEITPPEKISSDSVIIGADASWLECREMCLPGSAELSLNLAVNNDLAVYDKRRTESFARARNMLPEKNYQWSINANQTDSSIVIESAINLQTEEQNSYKVRFFPYDEGIYNNSKPQGFEYTSMGFLIEVIFADFKVENPEEVRGLLIRKKPDGTFVDATEIMVPLNNN